MHFWLILRNFSIFQKKLNMNQSKSHISVKWSCSGLPREGSGHSQKWGRLKSEFFEFSISTNFLNPLKHMLPSTKFFDIGLKMKEIYPRFQKYQYKLHIIHQNGVKSVYVIRCRKSGSKMADLGPRQPLENIGNHWNWET